MRRITRNERDAVFFGAWALKSQASQQIDVAHRCWVAGDLGDAEAMLGLAQKAKDRADLLEGVVDDSWGDVCDEFLRDEGVIV